MENSSGRLEHKISSEVFAFFFVMLSYFSFWVAPGWFIHGNTPLMSVKITSGSTPLCSLEIQGRLYDSARFPSEYSHSHIYYHYLCYFYYFILVPGCSSQIFLVFIRYMFIISSNVLFRQSEINHVDYVALRDILSLLFRHGPL